MEGDRARARNGSGSNVGNGLGDDTASAECTAGSLSESKSEVYGSIRGASRKCGSAIGDMVTLLPAWRRAGRRRCYVLLLTMLSFLRCPRGLLESM